MKVIFLCVYVCVWIFGCNYHMIVQMIKRQNNSLEKTINNSIDKRDMFIRKKKNSLITGEV